MDPMTIAMAVNAGSQVLGTLGGIVGANKDAANAEKSLALQREALDWQKDSFKNSAQYRMQDLEKAGLNPALAAAQGMSFGGASGSVAPVTTNLAGAYTNAARFLNETEKTAISRQAVKNALITQTANAAKAQQEAKAVAIQNRISAKEADAYTPYLSTKDGQEQARDKRYGTRSAMSASAPGFSVSFANNVRRGMTPLLGFEQYIPDAFKTRQAQKVATNAKQMHNFARPTRSTRELVYGQDY